MYDIFKVRIICNIFVEVLNYMIGIKCFYIPFYYLMKVRCLVKDLEVKSLRVT